MELDRSLYSAKLFAIRSIGRIIWLPVAFLRNPNRIGGYFICQHSAHIYLSTTSIAALVSAELQKLNCNRRVLIAAQQPQILDSTINCKDKFTVSQWHRVCVHRMPIGFIDLWVEKWPTKSQKRRKNAFLIHAQCFLQLHILSLCSVCKRKIGCCINQQTVHVWI